MATESSRDRLSNLPDSIIDIILATLPVRDVVRTSVLSTNWRYKWISVPYLLFNDECIPASVGSIDDSELDEIIDHVLQNHRGQILKFKISTSHLGACSEINSWILSLPLDSLTELDIQICEFFDPYSFPPSLFSFKHLIHLKLNYCIIRLPSLEFKGFRCLTSLFLRYVRLSDATLRCLLSSCPELEALTLLQVEGPTHIQLSNPKLKDLFIYGATSSNDETPVCCMIPLPPLGFRCLTSLYFMDVTLSDETFKCLLPSCPDLEKLTLFDIEGLTYVQLSNPKLKYLNVYGNLFIDTCLEDLKNVVDATFEPKVIAHPNEVEDCKLGHVLGFLLGIEKLRLGEYFLQSLPFLDVPRRLPSAYYHLTTISVTLNVEDRKEILGAICLLNSSPNLQELIISLQHDRQFALYPLVDLQEVKDQFESSFNKLLVVTINNLVGMEVDLLITKFILANSPVLQRMEISCFVCPSDATKVLTLLKKLLRFKRASREAEIEFIP